MLWPCRWPFGRLAHQLRFRCLGLALICPPCLWWGRLRLCGAWRKWCCPPRRCSGLGWEEVCCHSIRLGPLLGAGSEPEGWPSAALFGAWLWVLIKGPVLAVSRVLADQPLPFTVSVWACCSRPSWAGHPRAGRRQPVVPTREKFSADQQQRLPAAVRRLLTAEALNVAAVVAPEGMLPSTCDLAGSTAPPDQWSPLGPGQQRSSLLINGDAPRARPLLDKHRLVPG